MEKAECLQILKNVFLKDTSQKNNLSKLATEAR